MRNHPKKTSWRKVMLLVSLILYGCSKGQPTPPPPIDWNSDTINATTHVRKNYATNGHAESGLINWGAHGTAQISVTNSTAHSGIYSVFVGNRTKPWEGITYSVGDLKPGEKYDIAVWAKLAAGEPDSRLTLTLRFRGADTFYHNLVTEGVNASGWTQLKSQFVHPFSQLDHAYVESDNATVSFYLDDFTLIGDVFSQDNAEPVLRSGTARFNWFEYRGNDAIFADPLPNNQYQNPILAGFHPAPSITRVDDDYYLVHASFAYWPGIPIYHSKDLVHWQQIGHALTHQTQIDFVGRQMSEGIFAPTIRYFKGIYYIISTAVWAGGNFIVTAKDPKGPWSEPYFLAEVNGIDPEIFFDDDGSVYILHNDKPVGNAYYSGHRAIWLWRFDLDKMQVIPGSGKVIVNGGTNLNDKPVWIEGPHLYKKDGWYYLSCAEGGSGLGHSQVVFRTKHLHSPFIPAPQNPILTQRDLDLTRPDPIVGAGHADMVETQNGEWWAVFLANRTYEDTYFNFGRETYLLPVQWGNGWPSILRPGIAIPYRHTLPTGLPATATAQASTGNFVWRDNFDQGLLNFEWKSLRAPALPWLTLNSKDKQLVLSAQHDSLSGRGRPAFISRSQQHANYSATTELALPLEEGISAGIVAFQNAKYHYFWGVKRNGDKYSLFLELSAGSNPTVIESTILAIQDSAITLGLTGTDGEISFFYQLADKQAVYLVQNINGKILSSSVAGGVIGTHLGLHVRGY